MFSLLLNRWISATMKSKDETNDISLSSARDDDWVYNHIRDDVPINIKQHSPVLTDLPNVIADLKSKGVTVDDINALYNAWIVYNDVKHLPKEKINELFYKKIKEYLNYVNKRTPLIGQRAYKTEKLTEGEGLSDHYYRLYDSSVNIHTDLKSIQKTIDSSFKDTLHF